MSLCPWGASPTPPEGFPRIDADGSSGKIHFGAGFLLMMSSRVTFMLWRGGIGSHQLRDSSGSRGSRKMRNEIQMDPAGLKTFQTFQLCGTFIPISTTSAQQRISDGRGEFGHFGSRKATGNLGFGSLPVVLRPISPIPISFPSPPSHISTFPRPASFPQRLKSSSLRAQ